MQDIAFSLTIGTLTFLFTVVWGRPLITRLRELTHGPTTDHIPPDDAELEGDRRYVPTMGGLLVIVPTVVLTVGILAARIAAGQEPGRSILLPVAVMLALGGLGALDDWETMRGVLARRLSPAGGDGGDRGGGECGAVRPV